MEGVSPCSCGDGTARVWRSDGPGEPVVLQGHAGVVTSAAFSPEGQRLVTASTDGTARVWRADGRREPVLLRGRHGARVAVRRPGRARGAPGACGRGDVRRLQPGGPTPRHRRFRWDGTR